MVSIASYRFSPYPSRLRQEGHQSTRRQHVCIVEQKTTQQQQQRRTAGPLVNATNIFRHPAALGWQCTFSAPFKQGYETPGSATLQPALSSF